MNKINYIIKNKYILIIFTLVCILICLIVFLIIKNKRTIKNNNSLMVNAKEINVYKEDYNSKYRLNIKSAYGDIDAYHPKVISFDNKWNGYKYWLTFTPFPHSDSNKENPHILASNDLINWEEPIGYINPLDEVKGIKRIIYNSDPHLVYNDDLDRIECYWRYVNDEKNEVIIYRKYTNDGVNWSKKEKVIISNNRKTTDYISPAILYDNGTYRIWYVNKKRNIIYAEANKEFKNFKNVRKLNISYPEKLKSWHLDVIKTDIGYEMIVMAYKNWNGRKTASLYYTNSEDNINWIECCKILVPTTGSSYWDNRGIYRSSFLKIDNTYVVLYSGSNIKDSKGIGIVYGYDINNLNSVDINFLKDKDSGKKFLDYIK